MIDFALSSIIGKRDNQEDYGVIKFLESSGAVLAVIADGMGGQVAGEVASSSAVNGFIESFISSNSRNLPLKLNVALDNANRTLAKSINSNNKLNGMGATLIAAHIDSKGLSWVSVGDSILYLYRENKLRRLNDDHSMMPVLQDSVRLGKISKEEARVHPHRNALRSALTGEVIPIVDLREENFELKSNDLILLATDGILTLSEHEISQILVRCKGQSANVTGEQLLSAVSQKDKPRQDNTLVEVIKISGVNSPSSKLIKNIIISISMLVLAGMLLAIALDSDGLFLKTIGLVSKRENPIPSTSTNNAVVSPLPVEDNQPFSDNNQNVRPVPSEATSSAENGSTTKNIKLSANEKKLAHPAKNTKLNSSKDAYQGDSPKEVTNDASTIPASKPKLAETGAESPVVVMPANTNESVANDEERVKQLLNTDHTPSRKQVADGKE